MPGYLINLTAEFTIDGELQDSAGAGTMGETLYETLGVYSPAKGWHRSTNFSIAGEYRAIAVDLQGSSPEQAARLQADLEATKAILETGDELQLATLTKRQVVGQLLEGTIFSYFALNNVQDVIAAQSANITTYRAPSYGVFRTNIDTSYWFGLPRDIIFSGLVMDVDLVTNQTVDNGNDNASWTQFNQAIGARYSAMEHLVPELMFSTEEIPAEAISAVKALAIANAEGQKTYTIDNTNLNVILAEIQLSDEAENEIYNAVLAGNVVTTHQYQISFHDWIGEGYILLDPETGSGAYKISGGSNGGYTSFPDPLVAKYFIMASLAPQDLEVGEVTFAILMTVFGTISEVFFFTLIGVVYSLRLLYLDYIEMKSSYISCQYNSVLDVGYALSATLVIIGLITSGAAAVPAAILFWVLGIGAVFAAKSITYRLCE